LWCYRSSAVPYNGVPRNNTAEVPEVDSPAQNHCKSVRLLRRPACLHRGPVSVLGWFVWELMWTKWHWDRLFLRALAFPCHHYYTIAHSFACLCYNLSNSQRLKVNHLCFPFSHSVCLSLTSHLTTRTDPVSELVCPFCAIRETGQSPDAK